MKVIVTKNRKKIIVDNDIYEKVGGLKWYLNQTFGGKWCARRNEIPNSDCKYLHHYVLGRRPKENEGAFFKSKSSLDCRRSNLEFRFHERKNKGKYRGVRKILYYQARVRIQGKRIIIGNFKTEELAAKAYNKFCKENNVRAKPNEI